MPNVAHAEVEKFMQGLTHRSPGEPEFHQAVREVAESVIPFILEHEKYRSAKLLERISSRIER